MPRLKSLPLFWRIVIIVLTVLVVLLAAINIYMVGFRRESAKGRASLVKNDADLLGTRFEVSRDGGDPVKVNLYIPDNPGSGKLPVIFNIHGGGFVGGDADVLDTQSDRISNEWNAMVVTINYTKADVKPIDYGVGEVVDTVLYFSTHADEYNIDNTKFSVMGYSAGAYYASAAAIKLAGLDFPLCAQVLCYPFTTFLDENSVDEHVAPALFVLAGEDPISQDSRAYEAYLRSNGVSTTIQEYQGAGHSFIESNNPEGDHGFASDEERNSVINETQEKLARQAEKDINAWLQELYAGK